MTLVRWYSIACFTSVALVSSAVERKTIVAEPDVTQITISGRGCAPGGRVTARTTSMHGSANDFLRFAADRHGKFRRRIKVPFAGEDAGAGIIVHCTDPSGNEIDVFQVSVEYRCPKNSKSPQCGNRPSEKDTDTKP